MDPMDPMDPMDAKEILTRLRDGTLDKATAAALLRRAMSPEAPAAAPVGRGGSVTREQAEAMLRAAAAGFNAATAVGHRPAEPPAPGTAADKSGPAPGTSPQGPAQEPIAVFGCSARFPDAAERRLDVMVERYARRVREFVDGASRGARAPVDENEALLAAADAHLEEDRALTGAMGARYTDVREQSRAVVAGALDLEAPQVALDADLSGLGAMSFTMVRIAQEIARFTGAALPIDALITGPTVEALTAAATGADTHAATNADAAPDAEPDAATAAGAGTVAAGITAEQVAAKAAAVLGAEAVQVAPDADLLEARTGPPPLSERLGTLWGLSDTGPEAVPPVVVDGTATAAADPPAPYAPAAAPADATPLARLARVVAAETGLDAGRLDAGQDLFALGANLRQLVRIAARIAADGGGELSLETLLTAADLGALAAAAYPGRAGHAVPAHA